MGCNPQESLENTINTMGTLLGVHPIVPWKYQFDVLRCTSNVSQNLSYESWEFKGNPPTNATTPTSEIRVEFSA